ncbi:MAG: Tryptophan-specific transport protein [Chlamydiae bacterium]|nr:Tryptophan-specific transport protein [Chlamydiota bacterium]
MKALFKTGSVLGSSFIIAGTGIGAGMLGMPVVSAAAGFFPSVFVYIACYLTMIITGLLVAEIVLWGRKNANFLSLTEHFLGKKAKIFTLLIYIFLFYLLLIAYMTGSGQILSQITHLNSPRWFSLLFTLLFAPLILKGTKMIDRVNKLFLFGLFITYVGFVILGIQFVKLDALLVSNYSKIFIALPIIFTAFSYQATVPSICTYLDQDPKKIRLAIFLGTTIALVIYLIWQGFILSVIPLTGEFGLETALKTGKTAVFSLANVVQSPFVFFLGQGFAFCAIATSFLGVSLGIVDFIADGLSFAKKGKNLVIIGLLTFVPPLIFSLIDPNLFILALNIAGGLGCVILLGVLPILMYLSGRYVKEYSTSGAYLFGYKTLIFVGIFLGLVFLSMLKIVF